MIISHTVVLPEAVPPETPTKLIKYSKKYNYFIIIKKYKFVSEWVKYTNDKRLCGSIGVGSGGGTVRRRRSGGRRRRRKQAIETEAGEVRTWSLLHYVVNTIGLFWHRFIVFTFLLYPHTRVYVGTGRNKKCGWLNYLLFLGL